MSITYHLLPESEPFSEYHGGAISRWAANVLKNDRYAVIVAPSTDHSWGLPPERVLTLARLHTYGAFRKRLGRYCPRPIRQHLLKTVFDELIVRIKPGDVVWQHNRPEFARAISKLVHAAGARLVLHMHNSHLVHFNKAEFSALNVDHFVFCSNFLREETQGRFGFLGSSGVLHNGADERLFTPPLTDRNPDRVPVILFASRLVKEKGVHIFLKAMRILAARKSSGIAHIIGASGFGGSQDTPYVRRLRQTAPSNVTFEEYCVGSALADKFQNADIFCLPSVWHDPFPLAPLEAMATGLPVVATHSGGIPEALVQGGGLLVPRGSATELADAIQRLAANPALRHDIGRLGRASFLKNFTWAAVRDKYQSIVEKNSQCSDLLQAV